MEAHKQADTYLKGQKGCLGAEKNLHICVVSSRLCGCTLAAFDCTRNRPFRNLCSVEKLDSLTVLGF